MPTNPSNELRLLLPREKANFRTSFGGALLAHVALGLLIVLLVGARHDHQRQAEPLDDPFEIQNVVLLNVPGQSGGGGGGGNRSLAPPKQDTVPAVKPPEPEPVPTPEPEPTPEPVEPESAAQALIVATNVPLAVLGPAPVAGSSLGPGSAADGAGPGDDGGLGGGRKGGVGPDQGPSCCGGPGPGGADTQPQALFTPIPNYTSGAMERRIQGEVHVACVVTATGTVGDCKVSRSLDPAYGLDTEALRTARQFRFRPATLRGKPVPVLVNIILEFNIR